jgi:pre-mRNA-splicing factor ATP-dependent RNA helicase DHX15/PRP43
MYNEYVLTSKNYIRVCTAIKPEWLLELAPEYYDLTSFPDGDVKQALTRIAVKNHKKKHKKR